MYAAFVPPCGAGCECGFERVFSEKSARARARGYREHGLDADARWMARTVAERLPAGYGVLEVGGGIGALQIELLRAGAAAATNVELTRTYEAVASELLGEAGLAGRVDRRLGDFVALAADTPAADVVVMQRVVCCYPDAEALVGAAAGHARRLLLMSFPVERWWLRAGVAVANALLALRRDTFRVYVHPFARIRAAAEREGLRLMARERGLLWQIVAFER